MWRPPGRCADWRAGRALAFPLCVRVSRHTVLPVRTVLRPSATISGSCSALFDHLLRVHREATLLHHAPLSRTLHWHYFTSVLLFTSKNVAQSPARVLLEYALRTIRELFNH